jgi:hypothetical protein
MEWLRVTFDEAASDKYPDDWRINTLFWLLKPGKSSRVASSYRDICLMAPLAKAYSRCLLFRIKEEIVQGILPTAFGFLPNRGTRDALLMSFELQQRFRKDNLSLMVASFDFKQAFYKVNRHLLYESLLRRLQSWRSYAQLVRRFDHIVYRIHCGTSIIELSSPRGVVVGDVIGPLAYLSFMDDYVRALQTARQAARWPGTLVAEGVYTQEGLLHSLGIPQTASFQRLTKIDCSDVVFADDHDCHRPVQDWKDVRQELELIRTTQVAWDLEVNLAKSSVLVSWRGPHSHLIRGRRQGGVTLASGEVINCAGH